MDSAIDEASASRDIKILPHENHGQDPTANHPCPPLYNTFTPTPLFLKCVTYIRKNLNLSPQNMVLYDDHTLKITITINQQAINICNIWSLEVSRYIANTIKNFHPGPNA